MRRKVLLLNLVPLASYFLLLVMHILWLTMTLSVSLFLIPPTPAVVR